MLYLDVNNVRVVSLQLSATGLCQGFCQLPPREGLKVFLQAESAKYYKIETTLLCGSH